MQTGNSGHDCLIVAGEEQLEERRHPVEMWSGVVGLPDPSEQLPLVIARFMGASPQISWPSLPPATGSVR